MSYLIIYCILTVWERWLFITQRAALDFSRKMGISKSAGNYMLPYWYLTYWPNKIVRWGLFYFIFIEFGWLVTILCFVIPFLIDMFIPIPHRYFLPKFEKKLLKEISLNKIQPQTQLYAGLQSIRDELNMPKKGT